MRAFRTVTSKSTAAKVLGLFAVVLSFAFILSLVLTTGGVAFAAEGTPTTQKYHGNPTLGSATKYLNTLSNHKESLTAADFESTDDATVWTVTEEFQKNKAAADNHEVYTAMDLGNNAGDDEYNLLIQYHGGTEYVFKIGTYCNGWSEVAWDKGWERNWYMMSANYKISDFLKTLVKDKNFTVTFEMTMVSQGENLDTTFVGAWLTDKEKTGQENYQMVYYGNNGGNAARYEDNVLWHKGDGGGTDPTDKDGWNHNANTPTAITLTEDMNYVSVFAGAWYKTGGTSYKMTTIKEMSFIFTVTYTGDYKLETPTLSGDNGYAVHNDGYTLSSTRNWLHDYDYDYTPTVNFSNDVFAAFNKDYSLYTAVKYFGSEDEFASFKDDYENIANNDLYKSIPADNFANYGLDDLDRLEAPEFINGETQINVNLVPEYGAGLRLIYAWVVDATGNASGINSYYVLMDTTDYNVSVSMGSVGAGSVTASSTTVKRGQTVTMSVVLNER